MIQSKPKLISLQIYPQDIKISIIRRYKYFRSLKQPDENGGISKVPLNFFLKKMKEAKMLRVLRLKGHFGSEKDLDLKLAKMTLKMHSQSLRELYFFNVLSSTSNSVTNLLSSLKKLTILYILNDQSYLESLLVLRKIEKLCINITYEKNQTEFLDKILLKLSNLKSISLVVFPSYLDKVVSILNQISEKKSLKYQIISKEEYEYNNLDFNFSLIQNITKLDLQYLNSSSILQNLFRIQPLRLLNLRKLKLGFILPEVELASYLIYLKEIPQLEKLSLSINECWDTEFIEEFITHLHLPSLLQDLKLSMPIYFRSIINRHVHNVERENTYPWRKTNFFEEEPLFMPFFQALSETHHLKKVKFAFQIIETFNSYCTNFFVSMIERLPNLSSLIIRVSDYTLQDGFTYESSEPFDLALFFQACSRIKNLEHVEVFMPNFLFVDAEIDNTMKCLNSFTVGITENEEAEQTIKFEGISKHITSWLKRLLSIAPDIESLILDFTEVIDESTFYRRFMLLERFKQLEIFCSGFMIDKCSSDTANKVGKMLQSLHKLRKIDLKFVESDKSILQIRKHLYYHRSLKDVLVSFNEKNWVVKDAGTNFSYSETQYEQDDSSLASIIVNEASECQLYEFRL